jgi:TM2 domain-containing membrane protein YozV
MRTGKSGLEKALWSIAIPGFGQFLNGKYIKGIVLIFLEFLINVKANINTIIVSSFYGQTELAVQQANYQWLMFYPCVYLYSIWDAYRDNQEKESPLLYLPFAIAAYIETIGVIYSRTFRINGVLLGPIFLPMICIFLGLGIGFIIRGILMSKLVNKLTKND